MDPYLTPRERETLKSMFIKCHSCKGNIDPDYCEQYRNNQYCEKCALSAKLGDIGTPIVIVDRSNSPFRYDAMIDGYEPGNIIGYGDTISEALENWLQQMEEKFEIHRSQFTWTWRGPVTPEWWIRREQKQLATI